jgi:hypothetical protein
MNMKDILLQIFRELNGRIEAENQVREDSGAVKLLPVEIQILGQMSLLANEMAAQFLVLQRTGDLDALIKSSQHFALHVLKKELLPKYGLVFDDDSEKIWIPPQSRFEKFCDFRFVRVKLLDPESTLVSKAIKAPQKNKLLIVEAIASEQFSTLVERIEKHGGDLKFFLEDENE